MNLVNVDFKITASKALIITERALVRLELIVKTDNVKLKITALRAFIITETAMAKLGSYCEN